MSLEDFILLTRRVAVRWRLIGSFALLGFLTSTSLLLIRTRTYLVSATLGTVTSSGGGDSRLAAVASQLGVTDLSALRSGGSALTPDLLVQILRSNVVLRRILNRRVLAGETSDSFSVVDYLLGSAPPPNSSRRALEKRQRSARGALLNHLELSKNRLTSSVDLSIEMDNPSVAFAVASWLVKEADAVVRSVSQEQARSQRQFIEQRIGEQALAVRTAELRATEFLERNSEFRASPRLVFAYAALERELQLHQQLLVALKQSADQERIRELRDVPNIVVLDEPVLPSAPEGRPFRIVAALGFIGGALIGIFVAFRRDLYALLAVRAPRTDERPPSVG
jgi:uncharacterized protein involved in exopolysaccharide biosynthesis